MTVKQSYKLLSNVEARALVYQGILITSENEAKIELTKILKDLFIKDGIKDAFKDELSKILKEIDIYEVPSNYTNFYYEFTSKEKNEESFFFPLDSVTDRCYYYAINKVVLEEDGKLFGTIKEQVRERSLSEDRVSYKVYSTKYTENLCYCVAHSNQIQIFPEKSEKSS